MIIDYIKSNKANILLVIITSCFFVYILNFDSNKNQFLDVLLAVIILSFRIFNYFSRVVFSTRINRTTKINAFDSILFLSFILFFSYTWFNDSKFNLSFVLLLYTILELLSKSNHFLKLEENMTFKNQDKILSPVLDGFYKIETNRIILTFIEGEYQIRMRYIRKQKLAFLKSCLIQIEERLIDNAKKQKGQFERI